jgi:tetratricopeptide (TPR) repeat protein
MRLFGRESVLRVFDRILCESASDKNAFVLISGEPGVGKTALLASVAMSAEARGFRVMHAACSRSAPLAPGNPLIDLVRGSRQEPRFNSCGESKSSGGSDPGIFPRIRDLLLDIAQSQPLLVILDDLWALGENSATLLSCLIDALHESPILFLAACRPSAAADDARPVLESIARRAHNIELYPISRQATGELMESLISHPVDSQLLDQLWELTGGNPRLIVESERLFGRAAEAGGLLESPLTIPLGVRIAVDERLQGLSSEAGRLLSCASVVGSTFEPELVVRLAEMDSGQAWAAFVQLENERLVKPGDDHRYRFTQGFVREVLYQRLPHEVRSSIHRRIAMVLEGRHTKDLASYAEPIARHLLRSSETSALADAFRYAQMASQRFVQAGDFAKASQMLALAFNEARRLGYEDDAGLCDILTEWGIVQKQAGQLEAAEETFRQAIAYARRIANPQRLVRLALEVPDYHWPLPGCSSALAILLAENALQSLGERESAARALLTARLAAELSYDRTQQQRAEELANLAFEIAAKSGGEGQTMLAVFRLRDCSLRHPDHIEQRLANLTEMTRLARQLGDMAALWEATIAEICANFALGRLDELDRLIPVLEEASRLANRPLYRIFTLVTLAGRAAALHGPADHVRLFGEIKRAADEAGIPAVLDRCWSAFSISRLERNELVELEAMADKALESRSGSIVYRALKCWLDARLGRSFEARLSLERLAADDFADLRHCADFLAGAAALGAACVELGDVSHTQRIYDLLRPYANLEIALGQIAGLGSVSFYLGYLARALSDNEAALRYLESAVNLHLKEASPSWSLYGAFELAKTLHARSEDTDNQRTASDLLARIQSEAAKHEMLNLAEETSAVRSNGLSDQGLDRYATSNIVRVNLTGQMPPEKRRPVAGATAGAILEPSKSPAIFRREDEFWILGYQDRVSRVRHRKGLDLISRLVHKPYEAIHVVELASMVSEARDPSQADLTGLGGTETGPLLDSTAKRSYRERVRELREELEEARRFNDLGRVMKLEEELQFLTRELAKAVGLFGRDRATGSTSERTRVRVTNAIKTAIAGIVPYHAPLASHFNQSIKTGYYCAYRPEIRLNWEL